MTHTCLDIDAKDDTGKDYNIEVQRFDKGADKDASTELGLLMHDFFCTDADDMHYKELADKVRYFKEDEKGVEAMCKVMEDMRNETAKKAAEQEKLNIAQSLIKMGKLSLEEIAASVELSIDRIKELAAPKIADNHIRFSGSSFEKPFISFFH